MLVGCGITGANGDRNLVANCKRGKRLTERGIQTGLAGAAKVTVAYKAPV